MSSTFAQPDEPCPVDGCGQISSHIEPETVHNGVGEVPVEPDSWHCSRHGRWGFGLDSNAVDPMHAPLVLRVEYPEGPPPPLLNNVGAGVNRLEIGIEDSDLPW